MAQVAAEGSFAEYFSQMMNPYLPHGVHPEQTIPSFTGNILEQINLQVKLGSDPVREFDYTHPSRPLEVNFAALNQTPDRIQNGVWTDGRAIHGFEDDMVPPEPTNTNDKSNLT